MVGADSHGMDLVRHITEETPSASRSTGRKCQASIIAGNARGVSWAASRTSSLVISDLSVES